MRTEKETMKLAIKLYDKIYNNYTKLELNGNEAFFNAWHDTLQIHKDCAEQIIDDIEYCIENYSGSKLQENIDEYIDQLEQTVKYTDSIIKAQKYSLLICSPIFG